MPADPTDFSIEVNEHIVLDPESALRPVDAVITPCQYQEMFRIQNQTSEVVDEIVVRQYLPVNSAVQSLDWSVLADVDPRVLAAETRDWYSQGSRNRYVNWRIGPLEPDDVVQVGVVCGVTSWEPADPTSHGPAAGLHHPRAMVPPSVPDLDELKNLSSLCQFTPSGRTEHTRGRPRNSGRSGCPRARTQRSATRRGLVRATAYWICPPSSPWIGGRTPGPRWRRH